jgi:hypothetical protein
MSQSDDPRIVARGAWGSVEYATRDNGTRPAEEFIQSRDPSDQAKLAALFRRLADFGRIDNRQKFKKVEGDIFEFKSFQIRIGCFQSGRTWFLTHGFVKKQDRWPKSELERAQTIRKEHMSRS